MRMVQVNDTAWINPDQIVQVVRTWNGVVEVRMVDGTCHTAKTESILTFVEEVSDV